MNSVWDGGNVLQYEGIENSLGESGLQVKSY